VWWLLVAIFVPEVILFCASEQWWTAKQLQKEVNKYIEAGRDSIPGAIEKIKATKSVLAWVPDIVLTDEVIDQFRTENLDE
jgi:hypothetical protein